MTQQSGPLQPSLGVAPFPQPVAPPPASQTRQHAQAAQPLTAPKYAPLPPAPPAAPPTGYAPSPPPGIAPGGQQPVKEERALVTKILIGAGFLFLALIIFNATMRVLSRTADETALNNIPVEQIAVNDGVAPFITPDGTASVVIAPEWMNMEVEPNPVGGADVVFFSIPEYDTANLWANAMLTSTDRARLASFEQLVAAEVRSFEADGVSVTNLTQRTRNIEGELVHEFSFSFSFAGQPGSASGSIHKKDGSAAIALITTGEEVHDAARVAMETYLMTVRAQ